MKGCGIGKKTIEAGIWVALAAVSTSFAQQPEMDTRLVSVGDAQVEFVVSGPEDGEPVLLIHGALLGTAFVLVQNELESLGHRVIRIHRRGFGGSSDDAAPPQGPQGHAADAVAVLDDLSLESAHVVGHSAGATIALRMLADEPNRVRSIVMVDPGPIPGIAETTPPTVRLQYFPVVSAAIEGQDAEGGLEAFSLMVFGDDWRDFYDAVPGGYEQALADAGRLTIESFPGPPREPFDAAGIASSGKPIRVLWAGAHDGSTIAEEFSESLPAAETGVIDDTDHALITQRPNDVAQDISAYIQRVSN